MPVGEPSVNVDRSVLRPEGVWNPADAGFGHPQPFSQGVTSAPGHMVWVAGQVALDERGGVIGKGDPGAQSEAALENVQRVLAAGGATLADVVRLTVYLTDMAHLADVQVVRARYFPVDPPASSTIGITSLVNPDLLVEIDAVAIIEGAPS